MHYDPLSYDIVCLASEILKNHSATILLENIHGNKGKNEMKLNGFL